MGGGYFEIALRANTIRVRRCAHPQGIIPPGALSFHLKRAGVVRDRFPQDRVALLSILPRTIPARIRVIFLLRDLFPRRPAFLPAPTPVPLSPLEAGGS